jgi:DTW domain-containing protein YfiP
MARPPRPEADSRHCARCFLPHHLCLCPDIPRLPSRCRVVVVRHWYESWRTTNTGRLVHLALDGSDLLDHGHKDHRLEAADLPLGPRSCLLFPLQGDEAPRWTDGVPEVLIVPDGSWSQARRMVRRVPGLATLPRLELEGGSAPTPARRIRRRPNPQACSTLEAVAAALARWEPDATSQALLALYDRLAERMDEARYGYSSSGSM